MILECVIDQRYDGLGIFLIEIDTKGTNPQFTKGDVAMAVALKGVANALSYIDHGDYLILEGSANTKNSQYLVRVLEEGEELVFEATSDFITLEIERIHRDRFQDLPLLGKVVLTVQGRTQEPLGFRGDAPNVPY